MNDNNIMVSVIIPVYNRKNYLWNCVQSIMNQTYKNVEIIIVNDGSTDGSSRLCDELSKEDKRVVVIHQQNRGLCAARNAGLDIAKGEYICFIDSDDYIDARFVEVLLNAVRDENAHLARCQMMNINGTNRLVNKNELKVEVFSLSQFIVYITYVNGYEALSLCNSIYHRSLFNDLRFDESTKYAMDLVTICELMYLARSRNLAVVNQILYYRLYHGENMSGNQQIIGKDEYERGYRAMMAFWGNKNLPEIYEYYSWVYLNFCIGTFIPLNILQNSVVNNDLLVVIQNIRDMILTNKMLYRFSPQISAKSLWMELIDNKHCVLYGYGITGKTFVYPWLKHFNFPVVEIWDKLAGEGDQIDGIPFSKAHEGIDKDVPILITIQDKYVSTIVKMELRELGYNKFYVYEQINSAIRYGIYSKYMPFLLEE